MVRFPPVNKNPKFDPQEFNLATFIPAGYPRVSEEMFPLSQKVRTMKLGEKLTVGKADENNSDLIGYVANVSTISRAHLTIEKVVVEGETLFKISSGDGNKFAKNGVFVFEEYVRKEKNEWKKIESPEYNGCVLVRPGTLVALTPPVDGHIFRVEDGVDRFSINIHNNIFPIKEPAPPPPPVAAIVVKKKTLGRS